MQFKKEIIHTTEIKDKDVFEFLEVYAYAQGQNILLLDAPAFYPVILSKSEISEVAKKALNIFQDAVEMNVGVLQVRLIK